MYTPIDKASRGQSCGDGMKRGKERMRIIGTAVGCRLPEGPLVRSSYRAGEFFMAALMDKRPRASASGDWVGQAAWPKTVRVCA